MIEIRQTPHGLILPVRVTPRGGKDAFLPFQPGDAAIRIKVSVPPEDGKANTAVAALLAKALGLPKSAVSLVSGEKSRHKRLAVKTDDFLALVLELGRMVSAEDCEWVRLLGE